MSDLFSDYMNEIENFASRSERLYGDFEHLSTSDMVKIVQWLEGAFEAGLDRQ